MTPSAIVAFGPFELDCRSGELRKYGMRVRLADQPRIVLQLLLERPGELVTRDQIRQRLWPADTFVDFDAGLSSVIRKLRDALGDSAEQPRFIETLPRRGYRFIAAVTSPTTAVASVEPTTSQRTWTARWVVAAILLTLVAVALASTARRPQVSAEANDAFLKGIEAQGRQTVFGFRAAVAYFQQATTRQPDFALAYARMADAQLQLVYAGQFAPRDIVPQADAAAQRALALDDTVSLAHFTRCEILEDYYWNSEASDHELRRALQLDATTRNARTRRAFADLRLGRVGDAIDAAQEVRAADPLSAQGTMNLATILRAAGRFDEALAHVRGVLARDNQIPRGHFQLGVTYAFMGRWPEAIDALQRALQLTPDNTRFEAYLGFALAKAGRLAEARNILDDLHERSKNQYVSSFGIALIDDALGEHEAAVAALGRAYEDHALEFSQWYQYPPFKALEADPRYQAFWPHTKRTP